MAWVVERERAKKYYADKNMYINFVTCVCLCFRESVCFFVFLFINMEQRTTTIKKQHTNIDVGLQLNTLSYIFAITAITAVASILLFIIAVQYSRMKNYFYIDCKNEKIGFPYFFFGCKSHSILEI